MGIKESPIPAHWNYFLSLEDDVDRLSRFVEFTKKNFDCFSLELARILLTASSEVDVVSKLYCKVIYPSSKAQSIGKYKEQILKKNPQFPDSIVFMPRYGLKFKPWSNWKTEDISPDWWKSYNKVKHQRHTHFHRANLKDTLNSVAGLYCLLSHFYLAESELHGYQIDRRSFKNAGLFYSHGGFLD